MLSIYVLWTFCWCWCQLVWSCLVLGVAAGSRSTIKTGTFEHWWHISWLVTPSEWSGAAILCTQRFFYDFYGVCSLWSLDGYFLQAMPCYKSWSPTRGVTLWSDKLVTNFRILSPLDKLISRTKKNIISNHTVNMLLHYLRELKVDIFRKLPRVPIKRWLPDSWWWLRHILTDFSHHFTAEKSIKFTYHHTLNDSNGERISKFS